MNGKFEVREFRDEDLPALATHWKETIEKKGWPPGDWSTGDFTPEGIRQWLMRSKRIATYLGWLDDVIVSFLTYGMFHEDPDVTYVEVFNAHPDFHGQGYGRKIMTVCVDKAIRDKVKRLDLYTWSANTKAVPLYKKTGYFWRPRISWTHMYNFLPAVLNNPLVQDFLGDTWWYDSLSQNLELKENDELFNGCAYHKYTFEKDGKTMEVLVDPSTSGITGIKTDDFEIRCDVQGLTHVTGLPQKIKWTLISNKDKPTPVKIACKSSEGLDYSFNQDFDLSGEKIFESIVTPSPDLRPEKIEWYGKSLECAVNVDGVEFQISPGIRVVRPFEIALSPYPARLEPGEERTFILNLNSRVQDEVEYTPEIKISGDVTFTDEPSTEPVNVQSEGSTGIPLKLRAGENPGSAIINIGGEIKTGSGQTVIHPVKVHVGIAPPGQTIEVPDDDPDTTSICNGLVTIIAKKKGGVARIRDYKSGKSFISLGLVAIGEPYSSEFSSREFDISVELAAYYAELIYKIDSTDFPGISIERRVKLGNAHNLETAVTVHNKSEKEFNGLIEYSLNGWGVRRIIVPLKDRIVTGPKDSIVEGNIPLPPDPSEYPEPWVALETSGLNYLGVLFDGATQVNWQQWYPISLEYAVDKLQPGARVTLPATKLILNANDWQDVQAAALKGELSDLPQKEREYVHLESPIFSDDHSPEFLFQMMRKAVEEGSCEIRFPDGKSYKAESSDWHYQNPMKIKVPEIDEKIRGLISVEYKVTGKFIERTGTVPLIVGEPDRKISITDGREGDYDYFSVDNGVIEFNVSPEFCGSIYKLSEKSDPDKNLLKTPFPKPSMWVWWNPWYGGVWPGLDMEDKFYKSQFSGEPVKIEWQGFIWEGIKVNATPVRDWQSLLVEILYLTRPGYPVVLNLLRFTEKSGNRRRLDVEHIVFPCPSGDPKAKTIGLIDGPDCNTRIHASEMGTSSGTGTWAAIYDPDTGKTFGMVSNRGHQSVWDAAEHGQTMWWLDHLVTVPYKTIEMAAMYVIADKPELIPVLSNEFKFWGRILAPSTTKDQVAQTLK